MVVLAPGREIRPVDIPRDVREGGTRLLPMRMGSDDAGPRGSGAGTRELEFIFRTLVDLKVQLEDLKQRIDEQQTHPVEVIDVGRVPVYVSPRGETLTAETPVAQEEGERILYRPGMRMEDVERAAIEAALQETGGNRRRAAEQLGIGERTLYRKLKEYELA